MPSRPSPCGELPLPMGKNKTLNPLCQKTRQARTLLMRLFQVPRCPLKDEKFWTKISEQDRHLVLLALQKAEQTLLTRNLSALNQILQEKRTQKKN